jgi:hypothetical protein
MEDEGWMRGACVSPLVKERGKKVGMRNCFGEDEKKRRADVEINKNIKTGGWKILIILVQVTTIDLTVN